MNDLIYEMILEKYEKELVEFIKGLTDNEDDIEEAKCLIGDIELFARKLGGKNERQIGYDCSGGYRHKKMARGQKQRDRRL